MSPVEKDDLPQIFFATGDFRSAVLSFAVSGSAELLAVLTVAAAPPGCAPERCGDLGTVSKCSAGSHRLGFVIFSALCWYHPSVISPETLRARLD